MESSAHLKKSGGLQLGSLVRKLSVMMDLTMRSRDSKKRDATWRVFSCLLTPLKWEKRWSKQLQFHHLSSHWPWSESKIRWKDELTQLWSWLLAAYLEFCSSSNFLCPFSVLNHTMFENDLKKWFIMFENYSKCCIWILESWHFPAVFVQ